MIDLSIYLNDQKVEDFPFENSQRIKRFSRYLYQYIHLKEGIGVSERIAEILFNAHNINFYDYNFPFADLETSKVLKLNSNILLSTQTHINLKSSYAKTLHSALSQTIRGKNRSASEAWLSSLLDYAFRSTRLSNAGNLGVGKALIEESNINDFFSSLLNNLNNKIQNLSDKQLDQITQIDGKFLLDRKLSFAIIYDPNMSYSPDKTSYDLKVLLTNSISYRKLLVCAIDSYLNQDSAAKIIEKSFTNFNHFNISCKLTMAQIIKNQQYQPESAIGKMKIDVIEQIKDLSSLSQLQEISKKLNNILT